MEWLRQRTRTHVDDPHGETQTSNILTLHPAVDEDVGARALCLLEKAVQYIRETEGEAAARHDRAEALARNAIDQLKSAQERVRAAESANRAAEARTEQVSTRLRDVELQLER